MPSKPVTFLFGDYRIATASGGRGRYEHTFGGPPDRKGASRKDCKGILIHLLHRFDLTDPLIPFTIPGLRWLPFYYCFDFRANELGYRLISDDRMEAFFPKADRNVSKKESSPDDDYPPEFPKSSIKLADYGHDPTDLEDAYEWSGVFGIAKLSPRDQSTAKKRVAKLTKALGIGVPETEQDFDDALCFPFMQGKETSPCLNPKCPNRKKKASLIPLALMPAEPVKGVHTFGRWGGGVQLIIRICPKCYTVRVSNQCD